MANEKQEKKTPEIDVDAMVDNHVQKALKALEQFMDMTQEQVDKIFFAAAMAFGSFSGLDRLMVISMVP